MHARTGSAVRVAASRPAIRSRAAFEWLEPRRHLTTVSGTVFRDTNADAAFNGTDTTLSGVTVYLDTNNDSVFQSATEPSATTNSSGVYSMTGVASGIAGSLRLVTVPAGYKTVNVPSAPGGASAYTLNVGLFPITYTDANSNDAWRLRIDPGDSTRSQILINNVVTYAAPTTLATPLSFTFSGTNDTLTVDNSNGTAGPLGGLTFNGTAAASNNTLTVIGTDSAEQIVYYSNSLNLNARGYSASNAAAIFLDPRGGADTLYVNSGTLHIPAQTSGSGVLTRTFATLQVASNAKLLVSPSTATADRTVLVATSSTGFSIGTTGQLDLGNADLVIKSGSLATITSSLKTGYNAGGWNGNGLASSAAAATLGTTRRTALGVALNGSRFTAFDGVTVAAADVIVKYTLYGDSDLDGSVDINDFNAFAPHFGQATGNNWTTGDCDYDGAVGISDFNLLAPNFGLTL